MIGTRQAKAIRLLCTIVFPILHKKYLFSHLLPRVWAVHNQYRCTDSVYYQSCQRHRVRRPPQWNLFDQPPPEFLHHRLRNRRALRAVFVLRQPPQLRGRQHFCHVHVSAVIMSPLGYTMQLRRRIIASCITVA